MRGLDVVTRHIPRIVGLDALLTARASTHLGHAQGAGGVGVFLQVRVRRRGALVVVIGTTAMFPYIARPVLVAKSEGISTVEINPTQTDLSDVVDMKLRAQPAYALSKIWAAYESMTR